MGNSNVGARWQSQCGAFHPPPESISPTGLDIASSMPSLLGSTNTLRGGRSR